MTKRDRSFNCWHCGGNLGLSGGNVTFVGGYSAICCQDCRNTFHVYITNHPTFQAHHQVELDLGITAALTMGGGTDRSGDIRALDAKQLTLQDELYKLAEAWVNADAGGGK